jgi:outer membrane protein assembly factor BamB
MPTAMAARATSALILMLASSIAAARVDRQASRGPAVAPGVLTQRYDQSRSGATIHEQILNPGNVGSGRFGKLDSICVDGNIYAQPLILKETDAGERKTTTLIIATASNNVYAYDLATRKELWRANLGSPVTADDIAAMARQTGLEDARWAYRDVYPDIGIIATPVIDGRSRRLFVVAKSKIVSNGSTSAAYKLHALALDSGRDAVPPVDIAGSVAGSSAEAEKGVVAFAPFWQLNRPALLLSQGLVYVAFGSIADIPPFHGWVFAYRADDIGAAPIVYNTTPDATTDLGLGDDTSFGGGIWQSGNGLSADEDGNVYLATGNGAWDGKRDLSDAIITLDPRLKPRGWFSPGFRQPGQIDQDIDLGSTGVVLMPGGRLISGSKEGKLYILGRNELLSPVRGAPAAGHDIQAIQATRLPPDPGRATAEEFHHIHGAPVVWRAADGVRFYVWGEMDRLKAFRQVEGGFAQSAESPMTSPPMAMAFSAGGQMTSMPGGMLSLSANGASLDSGIVWATMPIDENANHRNVPGVLRAFAAVDVSRELWNSQSAPGDALGYFAKFNPPVVLDGRVYVASFAPEEGFPDHVRQTGQACISIYGLRGKTLSAVRH